MNDEGPSDSENSFDARNQGNKNESPPRLQTAGIFGNVQRLHPTRPSENLLRLQPVRPSENAPRLQSSRCLDNGPRLQVARSSENTPRFQGARTSENVPRPQAAKSTENAPRPQMSRPSENLQRPQTVWPSENVPRLQSGQPTENVPRLQPVRPSENVPPEISVYDCNSEEEDEAVQPPPSRKRAALSPLKPLNPTVSKTVESSQPTKAKVKYMGSVSGPSGLSVRQDSIAGSKDSPEQTENNAIYYVFSQRLLQLCDQVPKIPKRASMVHTLIEAYDLLDHVTLITPEFATKDELLAFHSQEYIEFLERVNLEEDSEKDEELKQQFGLGYDCPNLPLVYDFVRLVAGASLSCAKALIQQKCRIAINWNGGWHHARRDEAAGFCYVNDIVLAILKLKEHFNRVLYIDLDLHHGDAVDDAFIFTPKVMTVSLHKHSPGFFPGTGSLNRVGGGRGKFYTVSVPLKDGIKDEQYSDLCTRVMEQVRVKFQPSVVVVQCGADTLSSDPMQSFNLTPLGVGQCVSRVLSWKLPTLLLGGGGYNMANTARCWSYLTGLVLGKKLPSEIPDHEFFLEYGPGYQLEVCPAHYTNCNSVEYMETIAKAITKNLENVR
ncbi:histone deacetylase 8-like [Lytechinus pictus]|uniref:histone deacetylase 8-like n=1 Tax=Lytechinus pictus TaxID=7653 RepID=UPI0030B9F922